MQNKHSLMLQMKLYRTADNFVELVASDLNVNFMTLKYLKGKKIVLK